MQPPAYQYPQQPGTAVVYPPQPGQTNVVVSPAPVQTSYIVQNASAPQEEGCCSGTSMKFRGTSGVATGIIQLVIAILCIILGAASYAFPAYTYTAYGIWNGLLFFLPAGILGSLTKSRSTCVITAYLVMSILSAFFAFGMICYEGVYAGVYAFVATCSQSCTYIYGYPDCNYYCNNDGSEGAVAVHAILAILAVIEFIVSIVASAICCGGLRCCCASPTTTTTTTTTTTATAYPNQGYVVQPAQPAQPGQLSQPAPYENKM